MSFARITSVFLTSVLLIISLNVQKAKAQVRWLPASNGGIPSGAMTGGAEKDRQLYICKAQYKDCYHPGKIVGNNCPISWSGKEITISNYQVLTFQTQPQDNSAVHVSSKLIGSASELLKRGQEKLQRGDYKGAILDFNQALVQNPNDANIYFNRGLLLFELGDSRNAMSDFDTAVLRNPRHALSYFHRAGVRFSLGNSAGAIQDLQVAAKLFSEQGDRTKYQLAQKLIRQFQR